MLRALLEHIYLWIPTAPITTTEWIFCMNTDKSIASYSPADRKYFSIPTRHLKHYLEDFEEYTEEWYEVHYEILYRRWARSYGDAAARRMIEELLRQKAWTRGKIRKHNEERIQQISLFN